MTSRHSTLPLLALLLFAHSLAGGEPDESHWAFRRPVRPDVPHAQHLQWVRNPIDAFIAAEHDKLGLQARPVAEKEVLLRRVYLDLVGLPPTRDELHAFLADTSEDAYEEVVDRLLASPQYGERWGRHWMDVWRYSDWYGRREVGDVRNSYPHIWRWRDWIIRSLNEDKGYDRMVQEMLAADEIEPENDEAIAALGFIVRNWFSLNYDQWMKDLVEHTGKAFLGIRLNCAHCHDHKYDPITQEEYFRFRAFFEPLELRHDRVPGGPALAKYARYTPGSGASLKPIAAGLARVFDENLHAETYMYKLGDARNRFDRPPVEPGVPAALGGKKLEIAPIELPPRAWYPGLKAFVQREEIAQREAAVRSAQDALVKARKELGPRLAELGEQVKQAGKALAADAAAEQADGPAGPSPLDATRSRVEEVKLRMDAIVRALDAKEAQLAGARAQLSAIKARVAADKARYLGGEGDAAALAQAAARAEATAAVRAAKATLAVAEQGVAEACVKAISDSKASAEVDKANKQREVAAQAVAAAEKQLAEPGSEYTPLGPTYPKQSTGRRRALARWIASAENPLTARVAVNHMWMRHFGRPLVETMFDFGRGGKEPSHPELLDWLAVEFIESGWSMKHLHRLMVTSNTYRMRAKASACDADNRAIDEDNHFYWRPDRRRLEAEVIRDSILYAAGQLDATMGGPELAPELEARSKRRSLYFAIYPEGGGAMQFMTVFDAPDPCDCYRRKQSIVPQQALAMTNSELMLEASRILGQRLWEQVAAGPAALDRRRAFVAIAFEQVLSRSPSESELQKCLAFLERQDALFGGDSSESSAAQTAGGATAEAEVRAAQSLVRVLFNHNDFVVVP